MKKFIFLFALCLAGGLGYAQSYGVGGQTPKSQSGNGYEGGGTDDPQVFNAPMITTVAGNGTSGFSGNGGQATAASLNGPVACTFDASGNMYIADQSNERIRKVTTAGIISTFAGNGTQGTTGDNGQATAAALYWPQGIAFDASGNLYIADWSNRIRKVNTSGVISTVAGTGGSSFSGDGGQATAAQLNKPGTIKFDASGNMYFADWGNHCIRKITTSGIINTIAGTGGVSGSSGDGGQATAARLDNPWGIDFDSNGNLFISDEDNHKIRKVTTGGIISTYAGTGSAGYSGDGANATACKFNQPVGLDFDASGNLYIADRNNYVVRYINTGQIISTVAGNGTAGFSGDCGYSTAAKLGNPTCSVDFDNVGRAYIGDPGNARVRQLKYSCFADAGPNQTNYQDICGSWSPGVTVGTPSLSCLSYTWSPSTNLSPTNTPTATSTYSTTQSSQTITYTLTVTGSCVTATSTVNVTAVKNTCGGCCRESSGNGPSVPHTTSEFAIFPNPADDRITVALNKKASYIQIVNMHGQLLYEVKNVDEGEHPLDLSRYSKGIYFVIAKIGDKIEKQKLIVD